MNFLALQDHKMQRCRSLTQLGTQVERLNTSLLSVTELLQNTRRKLRRKKKKTIKISNKTFHGSPSLLGGPQGIELLQLHLHRATGFGNPYQLLPSIFTVSRRQSNFVSLPNQRDQFWKQNKLGVSPTDRMQSQKCYGVLLKHHPSVSVILSLFFHVLYQ